MAAWKLPLLVAAIAVPIAAAFYFGGPSLGVAVGALAAVAIVVAAVRQRPRGPIGSAPQTAAGRRLLVVIGVPLEDPDAIAETLGETDGPDGETEVMVLAPARIGFLDRWASDVEGARREAQERLVISVASLARAGIAAEARVGDEDPVQAVEDATASFMASEVILVTAASGDDPHTADAAAELRRRLQAPFRWLRV